MASDWRYLHQRRRGFYVAVEVPPSLRDSIGKRRIVRSLETRDLADAQEKRWDAVRTIKRELRDRARGHVTAGIIGEALTFRRAIADALARGDKEAAEAASAVAHARASELHAIDSEDAAAQFYGAATGKDALVRTAADDWLREKGSDFKRQTELQHRHAVDLLLEHVGEGAEVADVDRRRAGEFVKMLATRESRRGAPLSRKTVKRIVSSLSALWRFLGQRGLAVGENPWRDLGIGKAGPRVKRPFDYDPEKREVVDRGELLRLLNGKPVAKGKRAYKGTLGKKVLPDLIRLALFAGCRLDELCSLRAKHVTLTEGKEAIYIAMGKTDSAARAVPVVHPEVRAILARRCEGKGWVFPELRPGGPDKKRSWYASRAFTSYRRSLGIPDGETDFHSLRRNMATALEQAGVADNVIREILGHKKPGESLGTYSGGAGDALLRKAVAKMRYPAAVMRAV